MILLGYCPLSLANEQFLFPIDLEDSGVEISVPYFKWNFYKNRKGVEILEVGHREVKSKDFTWLSLVGGTEGEGEQRQVLLFFNFDRTWIESGHAALIDDGGRFLWKAEINSQNYKKWSDQRRFFEIPQLKDEFQMVAELEIENMVQFKKLFARPVKMCFSSIDESEEEGGVTFCSPFHRYEVKKNQIYLSGKRTQRSRFLIDQRRVPNKGEFPLEDVEKLLSFSGRFPSGFTYEVQARPKYLNLTDIHRIGKRRFLVSGENPRPIDSGVSILSKASSHFWAATVDQQKLIWQKELSRKKNYLFLAGSYGVPFKQYILFKKLPLLRERAQANETLLEESYLVDPTVQLFLPSGVQIRESPKVQFEELAETGALVNWTFTAENKGAVNRDKIEVFHPKRPYTVYHEIYRAHPFVLSGLFSGMLFRSSDSLGVNLLGDISFDSWYETLFGWENYYFGHQRWGFSARYTKSLFPLVKPKTGTQKLSILQMDFKYRFTPGVWSRTESFGLNFGYQVFNIDQYSLPMLGVGGFWSRSMPRIFDEMINTFSFLNVPKTVQADFLYFPQSLDSNVGLSPTYTLSFRAKLFLQKDFLFDVGFIIRSVSAELKAEGLQVQSLGATTSMGFGWAF